MAYATSQLLLPPVLAYTTKLVASASTYMARNPRKMLPMFVVLHSLDKNTNRQIAYEHYQPI